MSTLTRGMASRQPIVFVTDYGYDDAYGAALIGAVLRVDPEARCVVGTHGVPAGDVLAGAYQAKSLVLAFGRPVVLCLVVDPGVGTGRRALAVQLGDVICVAPDNGLISYVWEESRHDERRAVRLDIPTRVSNTFHGRDVFAPAAARLAAYSDLLQLGIAVTDPVILKQAFATRAGNAVHGCVVRIDRFGNAITTIRTRDLEGRNVAAATWEGGATHITVTTYDEIADGVAVLIGSAGHVEIAARAHSAAETTGLAPGDPVAVTLG